MSSDVDARPHDGLPFAQAPDWMLTAPLTMQAKMLYWALLAHVNRKRGDDKCWPSMDALAEMLGLKNRQSIARYVRELEAFGAIEVERNPSSTRRQFVYTVRQQPPAEFEGAVSIAGWHRARHERIDAAPSPAVTEVHAGPCSEDGAGPSTEMHPNHTNATHTNEPRRTTPSGEHAYAAGASFVAVLEAAGRPVYDETVNLVGRSVKRRLDAGESPKYVWSLFVSSCQQGVDGELQAPRRAA